MSWDSFVWFALAASVFWICGAVVSLWSDRLVWFDKLTNLSNHTNRSERGLPDVEAPRSGRCLPAAVLTGCGSVIFITFIIGVWISLGRPPLRTMGETRLWFSLFLSLVGLGVYLRWRYRWVLPFSTLMSVVFVCINIFKPEIHTEELMPALRSPWFVPHVIVYMFAYAVMGVATILAIRLLWLSRRSVTESHTSVTELVEVTEDQPQRSLRPIGVVRQAHQPVEPHRPLDDLRLCDTLVRIGWGFLTMGIVMGALWAKQAWGDYWTWDPKETWAAATWLSYLLYLHLRQWQTSFSDSSSNDAALHASHGLRLTLILLVISFILLQMCWWGVNYLPSAQGFSLHTY